MIVLKKLYGNTILLLVFCLGILFSCNDSSIVGADLLEQDQADIGYTDTFSMTGQILEPDTIITYTPSGPFSHFPFGKYQDQDFGRVEASIYLELGLSLKNPDFTASEPSEIRLDSAFFIFPYDSSRFFGDPRLSASINIYELAETPDSSQTYGKNVQFNILDQIGSKTFSAGDDISDTTNFLKVDMDPDRAFELLNLPEDAYTDDNIFQQSFKGLYLQPGLDNNILLNFDLSNEAAGLYLFFTRNDSINEFYQFISAPTNFRAARIQHDYTGSAIETALENKEIGDSILSVQSLGGVDFTLQFPFINQLRDQGIIVNKAELEMTVVPEFNDFTVPRDQLIVSELNEEGEWVLIDDVILALTASGGSFNFFGGSPEFDMDSGLYQYKMNLSAHFQDMIDGDAGNQLRIAPFQKPQHTSRSKIYGPKHSTYPIKLNLTFTKRN